MLTYRPVAGSRTAVGEPVALDVDGGNNLRRAPWWWEAGPVDTCCCGCSLRVGVGLLAMCDILALGVNVLLIFGTMAARKVSEATIAQMQDEYTNNCGEIRPAEPKVDCTRLVRSIERFQEIDPKIVVPVSVCLQGAFFLIAVVVGFWAVFGSNATAAKLYLWTRAPRLLWAFTAIVSVRSSLLLVLLWSGHLLLLVYFYKVVWSYHEVLKRGTLGSSPLGAAGDVELNASNSAGEPGSSGTLV